MEELLGQKCASARQLEADFAAGAAVLRFNYRGVNLSQGTYGYGAGELEDARAALKWLRGRYPGVPYWLAGFSFGSRIALKLGLEAAGVERLRSRYLLFRKHSGTGYARLYRASIVVISLGVFMAIDRDALAKCVEVIASCRGRVITAGVGTSAAAARKRAAVDRFADPLRTRPRSPATRPTSLPWT